MDIKQLVYYAITKFCLVYTRLSSIHLQAARFSGSFVYI